MKFLKSLKKSMLPAVVITTLVFGIAACNKQDNAAVENDAGAESGLDQDTAEIRLQCNPGEFADAAGTNKRGLKVIDNLYYGMDHFSSRSTSPSSQDVLNIDGGEYYVRSIPGKLTLFINGNLIESVSPKTPVTSVKIVADGGQVYVFAGSMNGVTIYNAASAGLEELRSLNHLGVVSRIDSQGGNVCLIANSGTAVLRMTAQGASGDACSQIVYEAQETGPNGKLRKARHVAASTDSCYVVTRSGPALPNELFGLYDFLFDIFDISSPKRIILSGIEDKLLKIDASGSVQEITPSISGYDHIMYSDLDTFTDGAIITYTAFKQDNWDTTSDIDMTAHPARKLLYLIKTFAEVRSGVLFHTKEGIARSVVLDGIALPGAGLTVNTSGGPVTFTEFPNLSLPWFPTSAVDGNMLLFKPMLGFSTYDIGQYADSNVVTLPVDEYTPWTNYYGAGGRAYGSRIPYDIKLSKRLIFTTGFGKVAGNTVVQSTYDFRSEDTTATPWDYITSGTYDTTPLKLNTRPIPVGASLGGSTSLNVGSGGGLPISFRPHATEATAVDYNPVQIFIDEGTADFPGSMPTGLPITDPNSDRVIWTTINPANGKLGVVAVKEDGTTLAFTTNLVDLNAPQFLPPFQAGAAENDTLVLGVQTTTGTWELYALHIGADGSIQPIVHGANNYFLSTAGTAVSVSDLEVDEGGKYSVIVRTSNGDVHKVSFEHDGSQVTSVDPIQSAGITRIVATTNMDDKIYAIKRNGDVIPIDRNNMSAGAPLGSLFTAPNSKIYFGQCYLYENNIYCTGLMIPDLFALYRFNLDNNKAEKIPGHHPLLSFLGGSHLSTFEFESAGSASFDLAKTVPEIEIDQTAGNANSNTGSNQVNNPMDNAPLGGAGGSGGCMISNAIPSLTGGFQVAYLVFTLGLFGLLRQGRKGSR